MKKFISLSLSFILAFALLVITPAEQFQASTVGFTSPVFQVFRYNQGQMFFDKQITVSTAEVDTNYSFFSLVGSSMDNSNVNMRFNFAFSPAGPQTDDYANLYGQSYNVRFSFGCKNAHNSNVYALVPELVYKSVVYITYIDGIVDAYEVENTVMQPASSFSAYNVSLDLYGFRDEIIEGISLSLYFNFHDCYGIPVDSSSVNAMDLSITNITYANTTSKPPSYDIPELVLPDVDEDGIPILDDYAAGGTQVGDTIGIFTSYGPVLLMMIIPTGVGVVGYILFGKRS